MPLRTLRTLIRYVCASALRWSAGKALFYTVFLRLVPLLGVISSVGLVFLPRVYGQGAASPDSPLTVYEGRFNNPNYLYAFTVPSGMKCLSNPPPMPFHGCAIKWGDPPQSHLVIDGSYNSLDLPSPEFKLGWQVYSLLQEGTQITVVHRGPTKLGDLEAERLALRHTEEGSAHATVEDMVTTFRTVNKDWGEMIYTVWLTSPVERYPSDKHVLEVVIASWRNELPPSSEE